MYRLVRGWGIYNLKSIRIAEALVIAAHSVIDANGKNVYDLDPSDPKYKEKFESARSDTDSAVKH